MQSPQEELDLKILLDQCLENICEKLDKHIQRPEVVTHNLDGPALQAELGLLLPEERSSDFNFDEFVEKILRLSVNTSSDGFMDKLYTGPLNAGIVAETILGVLNTNSSVYSVSPVLTAVEKQTAKKLCRLFGLPEATSGGFTVPGGSAANQTSLMTARTCLYPETKYKGNGSHRFVCFTSEEGHYSVEKAALMAGLGLDAVIKVKTDERGQMRPDELERLVQAAKRNGQTPFYVNATAGTTVMGAFDPFNAISTVCKKHNLWMHVDVAWGGGFLFSQQLKASRMKGIEQSDSITFDAHKMLGVPILCSFLLVRDTQQSRQANSLAASYLFHSAGADTSLTSPREIWDLGDSVFQCGRRGDALKLALCWEYYGSRAFQRQVEEIHQMAEYLTARVQASPDLRLANNLLDPPPCAQVCFYASRSDATNDDEAAKSALTRRIVARLKRHHNFMVDYASSKQGDFLRVVVNRMTTRVTIDRLITAIEAILKDA